VIETLNGRIGRTTRSQSSYRRTEMILATVAWRVCYGGTAQPLLRRSEFDSRSPI